MGLDFWNWGKEVAQKRSMDTIPQKVYVQDDGRTQTGMNYEYSEYEPAALNWGIENLLNGGHGRQNFITLFYCLPEIFAPVHEIASRVADADWQLRRNMDDGIDYKNPDWNRLSSKPNPLMNFKQLVYQDVCYELLTGASFQNLNKPTTLPDDPSSIISWWNLPSHQLKIDKRKNVDLYSITDIRDLVAKYSIGDRVFDVNNVMSIMNFDLSSGNDICKFQSPLQGAHLAIKNLIPVYEARGVIFVKRGALGFLVSKKSDESGLISLTKTEKEDAQRVYDQSYGLRRDQNQVSVTAAPLEFIKTSMSIQELQPFDETLADAISIYKCLRVPAHLVPRRDQSTYANADADMKSFYEDVIIPTAARRAQTWTNELKIPNRYIYADFSKIGVLQENKKDLATVNQIEGNVYLQRFTNGICTLNDWVVATGNEKVTGNGLYDKKLYQMSPEELTIVKNIITLKANSTTNEATSQNQGTQTAG